MITELNFVYYNNFCTGSNCICIHLSPQLHIPHGTDSHTWCTVPIVAIAQHQRTFFFYTVCANVFLILVIILFCCVSLDICWFRTCLLPLWLFICCLLFTFLKQFHCFKNCLIFIDTENLLPVFLAGLTLISLIHTDTHARVCAHMSTHVHSYICIYKITQGLFLLVTQNWLEHVLCNLKWKK